jgi:Polysaccharide pyruvyl transferase
VKTAPSRTTSVAYLGWTGHGNMGDEAIHQALAGVLPGVELTAAPLGVKAALRHAPAIPALRRYPLVLGGGTVLGRRIWRYHLRQALLLSAGDAYMLGAGVEDPDFERQGHLSERRELPRWRELLARFDKVTVRGPRSAELLGDAGIDAAVIGDPALLLDPPPGTPVDPVPDLIGINLGVSDDLWGHDQGAVVAAVATAVGALAAGGWRFAFLVVNPADAGDARRCAELAGLGADRWRLIDTQEPDDYLRATAACRLVIAERLHAAVLAARLAIPVVTLEYQPKCRDFLRSVGAEHLSIRTDQVRPAELVDLVTRVNLDHDHVASLLDANVEKLRGRLGIEAGRLAERCGAVRVAS